MIGVVEGTTDGRRSDSRDALITMMITQHKTTTFDQVEDGRTFEKDREKQKYPLYFFRRALESG